MLWFSDFVASLTDVSGLTGLRVQLVKLGNPPHLPGRTLSRFYALKEMSVMGSCMCHGHANRCLQDTSDRQPSVQVRMKSCLKEK